MSKEKPILIQCVEEVIGRGLSWFNYEKSGQWQEYFNDAQYIINNETFNNELLHYNAELVKQCATMDGLPVSTDKLIKLTNLQFGLVVLETLKDRFESVKNPKTKNTEDFDPNEEI